MFKKYLCLLDPEEKLEPEEEKEVDDEEGLTNAQVFAFRAKKIKEIKIKVAQFSLSFIENPEENVIFLIFLLI